jgi:hypothetical protein
LNNTEGRSGMSPPGPSMTGSHGNCSIAAAIADEMPWNISVVFAERKHANVEPDFARDAQDGTPATNVSHPASRCSGAYRGRVA